MAEEVKSRIKIEDCQPIMITSGHGEVLIARQI